VLCSINASKIVRKARDRERGGGKKKRESHIIIYILAMHDIIMLAMRVKINDKNGRKPRTNDMI